MNIKTIAFIAVVALVAVAVASRIGFVSNLVYGTKAA